jgi:predicted GIY-YIG superfamily endonuclease
MRSAKRLFVYILSSDRGVLYTGVTNDLLHRLQEHLSDAEGLTAHDRVRRLVYWEEVGDARAAVTARSRSKGGSAGESSISFARLTRSSET